jgi:hypothetical protein
MYIYLGNPASQQLAMFVATSSLKQFSNAHILHDTRWTKLDKNQHDNGEFEATTCCKQLRISFLLFVARLGSSAFGKPENCDTAMNVNCPYNNTDFTFLNMMRNYFRLVVI